MNKILNINDAINISKKLKLQNKIVVLAGGCFDILHQGHIEFLKKAKEQGDYLLVLLESDEKIQELKGIDRPIHDQKYRAKILASLSTVNYVIILPKLENNQDYDKLITSLKPDIIAATKGDKYKYHKERQAKIINAKVVEVTDVILNKSTTNLLEILNNI